MLTWAIMGRYADMGDNGLCLWDDLWHIPWYSVCILYAIWRTIFPSERDTGHKRQQYHSSCHYREHMRECSFWSRLLLLLDWRLWTYPALWTAQSFLVVFSNCTQSDEVVSTLWSRDPALDMVAFGVRVEHIYAYTLHTYICIYASSYYLWRDELQNGTYINCWQPLHTYITYTITYTIYDIAILTGVIYYFKLSSNIYLLVYNQTIFASASIYNKKDALLITYDSIMYYPCRKCEFVKYWISKIYECTYCWRLTCQHYLLLCENANLT